MERSGWSYRAAGRAQGDTNAWTWPDNLNILVPIISF